MYEMKYHDRKRYACDWLYNIERYGWIHVAIGFLHSDMKEHEHIPSLDKYYGDIRTFPEIIAEGNGELDDIMAKMSSKHPLEFECVT